MEFVGLASARTEGTSAVHSKSNLKVYSFVGQVFIVEVMAQFRHTSGYICARQKILGEVSPSQAQAGFRVFLLDKLFQIGFGDQFVMQGIINLIADHQIKLAAGGGGVGFFISLAGGFPVLCLADILIAKIAGIVKTLAALLEQQFFSKK